MLNMKWTLGAVILAAAFAGTASQASAQTPGYRGTFKLPFEARFGKVVLEPGTYKIATIDGATGIRITGENRSFAILAAGSDLKPATEKAKLILVDSNGMYALQSFESGSMGAALDFLVVKTPRGAVERAAVKPTIEVGLQ
jgi:hypothetical protein